MRKHHFFLRRLHSLSGVLPLGVFVIFHITENFSARNGALAFNQVVVDINAMALLPILELGVILGLFFHAGLGVAIALEARHNVMNYSWGRNWAFFLQRITGIFLFVFILVHLYHFRFQKLLGQYVDTAGLPTFQHVSEILVNPWWAAFYVLGVISASYHLFNGLHTFMITWGILVGPRSQRISATVTNLASVAFALVGVTTVIVFR